MIELTVIGGYLGSGKTTLLNQILDRQDGERIAVIINDFGTVNIDAEIIGSRDGRTMEIANGCICCDLSDGMAAAVAAVRRAEPPVSRIYVEVSGVGQPDIVARWGDHPGFSRGGAVVCADVTTIRRDVKRKWVGETVLSQLRGADRLLLTKTDLVDDQTVHEVADWLISQSGINAEVVDRSEILSGEPPRRWDLLAEDPTHPQQNSVSDHVSQVHSSWTITTSSAIDPDGLRALVQRLPKTFVRAKGTFPDRRHPGRRFLIQYDGSRCATGQVASAGTNSTDPGHLVLIAVGSHTETPAPVNELARALHGQVGG
ncbi:MAG: CobW family GTP-binding protein [Actinomycetota bacterium]